MWNALNYSLDDPPERASRIRSQVLERFHNKLIEGEQCIQQKRQSIHQTIRHQIKELERDYQRKRKAIEKQFYQLTKNLKEELVNVLFQARKNYK